MDVTIKCSDDKNLDKNETKNIHPYESASVLAKVFFCWTLPLFWTGFKKDLDSDELFSTLDQHDSAFLTKKLEDSWNYETEKYENPSLLRAIWRVFGREFLVFGASVFCLEFIVRLSQPLLIWRLMIYHTPQQKTISREEAFIYAFFIVLSAFLNVLIYHSTSLHLFFLGTKIKIASCSLIYRKSLRLAQCDSNQNGKVLNLVSNDLTRLDKLLQQLHYLWCAPLEAIIVAYLLYVILGPTALAGYVVFLVFIPVQTLIGKLWAVLRLKTAKKTDKRIQLLNEIISGIRIIKMHAWEKLFIGKMDDARKAEIRYVRQVTYLRAIHTSCTKFVMKSAVFLSLLAFVLTGNHIHARYVFVAKSFYNFLKESITNNFPHGVKSTGELLATFTRIQQVLLCGETSRQLPERKRKVVGISFENIYANWGQVNVLKNVTFTAGPKQLVAVVGPVGSGKTSLMNAILGELPAVGIKKEVTGKLSYAAQEPWIFAGTIRQNILLGLPMNSTRYKKTVKACALEQDLDNLPLGDCSVVGEKGVTLSGGQRARIGLARAVYRDVDIYLLDDPLSAVDATVGKHLFEECILKFLMDKCVVLVTHHLQYLKHIDLIYELVDGIVVRSGTHKEMQKSPSGHADLSNCSIENELSTEDAEETKWESAHHEAVASNETKNVGTIPLNIYWDYLRSGGNIFFLISVALTLVLVQSVASYADYFEAFWVNMEQNGTSEAINVYIYSYLVAALVLLIIFSSICFYTYFTFVSINLHNKMFSVIINTTMAFFHSNPSGRILNRFSKDVGAVDEVIPQVLMDTLHMGLNVAAVTVIVALVNPWIALVTITLLVLFYLARTGYLATIRDVKRIEAVSRSPLITHLNASLHGVTTIRAFGVEKMFGDKFDVYQNAHTSANYTFLSCRTTFGFWLDFCCAVYISIVTVSCFLLEGETSGNIGLMLTQAISLSGMFQFGMKQWSELETQMTSVERIAEYASAEQEPDRFRTAEKPHWPNTNDILFQNVSVKYDACLALNDVTFPIAAKEKIGIVGRTGAGKSSIISAMFRLVDFDGQIVISGTPISQLPLQTVRSKIAIIPQEPVLFSGTLRSNLDPFSHFSDASLWQALEDIELKKFVGELPAGLQCEISEGGSNLSVGQRQLFCLARALLLENKILVLDEATANVDLKTDSLIQETMKKKFADCTVLVIAHRLPTVMECDKILVLDSGRVVEFGRPDELLRNENGALHGFVAKSGVADRLHGVGKEAYFGTQSLK